MPRSEQKDVHIRPKRQKTSPREEICCPACSLSLRPNEAESHVQTEILKLYKIPQNRILSQRPDPNAVYTYNLNDTKENSQHIHSYDLRCSNSTETSPEHFDNAGIEINSIEFNTNSSTSNEGRNQINNLPSDSISSDSTDEVYRSDTMGISSFTGDDELATRPSTSVTNRKYLIKKMTADQIKRAREVRGLRSNRVLRRQQLQERLSDEDQRTCMQCSRLLGPGLLYSHAAECTEESSSGSDSDGEGTLPQYEWCGQTRVRVTDLLRSQGQLHSLGTVVARGSEDDEVDVCEDEDFGAQQFFEEDNRQDGIPSASSTAAMSLETTTDDSAEVDVCKVDSDIENNDSANEENHSLDAKLNGIEYKSYSAGKVKNDTEFDEACSNVSCLRSSEVESLRLQVKRLELQASVNRIQRLKCSVCRDDYDDALVSTVCWHVHCKQCWLSSIATRRQCPQCKAIFSLSNLRRLYL